MATTCVLCGESAPEAWLYFVSPSKGKRIRGQIPLCTSHGEMIYKHLKRALPKSLFTTLALLLALVSPLASQTPTDTLRAQVDSLRADQVRQRGFNRSAETTGSRAIERTDAVLALINRILNPSQPEAPPTVQDWRTGEWDVNAAGFVGTINLTTLRATVQGVTAPIVAQATGDTLRVRLAVQGYENGILELVHAEGRMIGTVTRDTIVRPAAAQRLKLEVVRTVRRSPCTFAQYTDGSWGVAPYTAACHQALDAFAGPFRFAAREYVP